MTASPQPCRPQGRVLVVDDEDLFRELVKRILEPEFEVCLAEDVPAAEELLAADPDIDVILCDETMPTESGLRFCQRLCNKQHPAIRVLITGHASTELAIAAVNEHALFLFLQKPVSAAMLQQAVRDALRERRRTETVVSAEETAEQPPTGFRRSLGVAGAVCVSILMVLGVALVGGLVVLAILYSVKTLLGIDIFSDHHLSDYF